MAEGASRRQAAERFGDSSASAIRWQESFERDGRVADKPQGGEWRSQHLEAQADLILSLRAEQPTLTLAGSACSAGRARHYHQQKWPVALLPVPRHCAKKTRFTPPSSSSGRT
ncbi:hypothetical protein [Methylorubrum sp. GM97]|uniref:hypothetical protein n=1 Tax=Methylorubrum sp. GM97 TaxID=2938232 RepID=UPI0021C4B3D2|nr:hypothetical protein [Methylorubrum sp. GM97]